jgi:2-C-methyl-D-erythritol 4-phosphate cytidylyltransferase/2-C-methyl-D-erythritol 2,4-cyclodiphosphate synthase
MPVGIVDTFAATCQEWAEPPPGGLKGRAVADHVWAILAAAGRGNRFGASEPKQFLAAGGATLLERAAGTFLDHPAVEGVVLVLPADRVEKGQGIPDEWKNRSGVRVVAGGSFRAESVRRGLQALPPECDLVLVHDAARPCASASLLTRVIDAAWRDGACVPVVPVVDAVCEVDGKGLRVRGVDRQHLRLSQTPQGFRREVLEHAYHKAGGSLEEVPDEGALVAAAGDVVVTVPGEPDNIKVTVPRDLKRAGLLIPRVGHGYDVHRLGPDRKLILGGVEIPHPAGLIGHSDGDVVLHALADAVLGAACGGDIGRHFPDDDPAFKDADSLDLLRRVVGHVRGNGWRVVSADLTVVAQQPRLAAHLPGMEGNIAGALGVEPGCVNVKATTEEGLGFTGTGQGIAAHAVAVLLPRVS